MYNQIDYHYQWIKWGAEVKMEGVDEEAAVHDAIDVEDDEGSRGEEAKQDDVREAARGMLAMGRTGEEETVRFVDGIAYHPRYVGRQFYEQIHAMDRPMDRNPTAESEMHYPAKLVCVFFLDDEPHHAVVDWDDYTDRVKRFQLVSWDDVSFETQLGKGKRKRRQTDFLRPGQEEKKKRKQTGRKVKLTGRMQEVEDHLNGDEDDEESVQGRGDRLEDLKKKLTDEADKRDK